MIEHHIQKHIIHELIESQTARYADLKPSNIEGNVFTYHLHFLEKQKYITKNQDGLYELTAKGKLYGINNNLSANDFLTQAHSAIFLYVVNNNNEWLLRKRLVQPMFGGIGFMHGEPVTGQSIEQTASAILRRRCGLDGTANVKGSGYIHLTHNAESIAYTHFTLVSMSDCSGDFIALDAHGENGWYKQTDIFTNPAMLPSMPDIARLLTEPGLFFIDQTYQI